MCSVELSFQHVCSHFYVWLPKLPSLPILYALLKLANCLASPPHPCSSAMGAIFTVTELLIYPSPWFERIEGATDGALEISDTMLWWPGDPGIDSIDGVAFRLRPCPP